MQHPLSHRAGFIITALGVLVLTPDTLLMRMVDLPPHVLTFWRNVLLAAVLLSGFAIIYRSRFIPMVLETGKAGLLIAILYAVNSMTFVQAVDSTGIAQTLVIIATAPAFAAIMSILILKEKVGTATWATILLSFSGIGIVFAGDLNIENSSQHLFGGMMALVTAVMLAAIFIITRKYKSVNMIPATAVGGVFGVFLLIFLTPVLSEWALAFGPSHLFWLAILGVTVIGSLESNSVVKGLLSGCIGLWLATIGFDDIMGAQRFIFHPALGGGINIIAALIGLFAIPQVLTMFSKGRQSVDMEVIEVQRHSLINAVREIVRRKRALTIGTVTGSIIGLIPGVGGQIAGLVAYDQTKKFSPESEKFGTGHTEGVIAAEAANNAMVGPSLVPLLTLSIPGSPTAAVLLGGLLIHGIFPGTDLFDNHPDVAWTFINSMLIGQILMCIFGLYVAGLAARVAQVPQSVMAAVVLGLAVFGSYSVQSSMGDVYVMASLGIMMFFLERFGFSAAPLVLGLILGPIAEANFIQGSMIANATDGAFTYFFGGPLNIFLIAFVVFSIIYSAWMEIRTRRNMAAAGISV